MQDGGRLRAAGVEVEVVNDWDARVATEAWRWWAVHHRPFVTYKVAATLDGRVTIPGERWVSGEAAASSTSCVRSPMPSRSDGHRSRRRPEARRAGRPGRASAASARVRAGPAAGRVEPGAALGAPEEELRALGAEGVQSLLLEGGPTRDGVPRARPDREAARVRRAAPRARAHALGDFAPSRRLDHVTLRPIGDDVLSRHIFTGREVRAARLQHRHLRRPARDRRARAGRGERGVGRFPRLGPPRVRLDVRSRRSG